MKMQVHVHVSLLFILIFSNKRDKNTSRSVVVDFNVFFPLKNLLHPYFHDKRRWPVVVSFLFFRCLPPEKIGHHLFFKNL